MLCHAVSELLYDWIWEVDAEFRFTSISNTGTESLDSTHADFIGQSAMEVMLHGEPERITSYMTGIVAARQSFLNLEHRKRCKDGSIKVFLSSGMPKFGPDGSFLGYIGVTRDSTAEKRADEVLVHPEELFRSLKTSNRQLRASEQELQVLNTSLLVRQKLQHVLSKVSLALMNPDSEDIDETVERVLDMLGVFAGADRCYIFFFSDDGCSMSCTHEWCAEGIDEQKLLLQDISVDIVPWWMEHHRNMEPVFIRSLSDLPPEAVNEKVILEPQGIRSLLALPMADRQQLKGFLGLDWVRNEVSAICEEHIPLLQLGGDLLFHALHRELANQTIKDRESKYRLMFENMQDVYLEINIADSTILEISPSIQEYGYTRTELLGRPVALLYSDLLQITRLYKALAQQDTLQDYELEMHKKDGSLSTVSLAMALQRDQEGKPCKIICTARDISARKQYERYMEENVRLKNDFISNVSHELRTPLFSILGFSNHLVKHNDRLDNATRYEFASIIKEESLRLSNLIEDLLTISRIDSGKTNYNTEDFDPREVISASLKIMQKQADDKRIRLEHNYPKERRFVRFDRGSLQQVLTNLLSNALKFTASDGHVQVRIENAEDVIRIDVEDTGIGIQASEIEKIFEKFYRGKQLRTTIPGTGLGLAIIKELLFAQGGAISVKSELGCGSTFTLELPASQH